MAVTIAIGVAKTVLAFAGDWARLVVPRAALLGSIAAVSILLIAFLPALKVLRDPLVGIPALSVLLLVLLGGVHVPFGIPGAFAAVGVGTIVAWLAAWLGASTVSVLATAPPWAIALPRPTLAWLEGLAGRGACLPLDRAALCPAHHDRRDRQHRERRGGR